MCVRDKSVMEGGWRAGEAGQGVGKRWCAHPHSSAPLERSLSEKFHFCAETLKKLKVAEISMFCTSGLGLFELRGRILRGKRPPDQQAACGVGQGKRAPPPGALCGAPGTLQPNNRPRQRCPGIARGRPVAARRRRAMRPCTCMRWTRACALLTRGSAGSAAT